MKSTPAKSWEEQFDEKFIDSPNPLGKEFGTGGIMTKVESNPNYDGYNLTEVREIKSFIRTLIKQAKAERDEEILEMIEGMMKKSFYSQDKDGWIEFNKNKIEAYNQALTDLKEKLEGKNE